MQFLESEVARGYLSSVESILHFGLGSDKVVDSLHITWPNGREQHIKNVQADQVLSISYDASATVSPVTNAKQNTGLFDEVKDVLVYNHEEEDFIDYNVQRTLPHKFSQSG